MHPRGLAAAKRWLNIALSDRSRGQSARARTETVLTMLANGNEGLTAPRGRYPPGGKAVRRYLRKSRPILTASVTSPPAEVTVNAFRKGGSVDKTNAPFRSHPV